MRYELYFLNGKSQSAFDIDFGNKTIKFISPKKETIYYCDTMKDVMNAENNIIMLQTLYNYGYDKKEIYAMIGLSENPTMLQIFNHNFKTIKAEVKQYVKCRSKYLLNLLQQTHFLGLQMTPIFLY